MPQFPQLAKLRGMSHGIKALVFITALSGKWINSFYFDTNSFYFDTGFVKPLRKYTFFTSQDEINVIFVQILNTLNVLHCYKYQMRKKISRNEFVDIT